jgi:NAD(P)-dependent dehydrogenase (short-subunit alcohol dehydrogenase family)
MAKQRSKKDTKGKKKSGRKKSAARKKPDSFPPQVQRDQPGDEHRMRPAPETIRDDYQGCGKLEGKVALITGGDSGIGRAAAVHFAREGADVAIVYLEEGEDARATKAMVEEEGQRCLVIAGDVRKAKTARDAVKRTVKALGGLNVLVNNAAWQEVREDVREITEAQLERTFRTNIFAFFYFAQAALDHLKEGDSIINVASVLAFQGSGGLMDYAATKGAIVAFTHSLAESLAPQGIRVNAIAPGPIWTPLIPASFDEEKVSAFGTDTPLGRAGQPSEVGPAFVFLASDDASYITGATIHVNGGKLMA